MRNDLLWVEKYRPRKIDEVIGNEEAKAVFVEWLKSKRRKKRAALLYGPPGVGKTALTNAAANEFGFKIIEMNASDTRTEKAINKIAQPATSFTGLDTFVTTSKGNLLFLDEVDGVAGREDRGGIGAIVKIVKASRIPVIMAANDPDLKKIRPLKKVCVLIRFHHVRIPLIIETLRRICRMEQVEAEFEALERIAQNSKGDVRSAINDLQSLSQLGKVLTLQDTMVLKARNKNISMEESLRGFFSVKSLAEAKSLLRRSRVDYDYFLMSVSDNLPKRYRGLVELAEAYDLISRADTYRGRIGKEHWHLLKYFYNLLAKSAAVSPESYKPFELIAPPIRIITLFWTKGKRSMLEAICAKIALRCHVSRLTAKNDFIPYLKIILDKHKSNPIISWLKLTPNEVDYLVKMKKI